MAKKSNAPTERIVLDEPYYVATTFRDITLVPVEAIDPRFREIKATTEFGAKMLESAVFITKDNKKTLIKRIGCFNSNFDTVRETLDWMCQEYFGKPFDYVESVWVSRLNTGAIDYWELIKMRKI